MMMIYKIILLVLSSYLYNFEIDVVKFIQVYSTYNKTGFHFANAVVNIVHVRKIINFIWNYL